MNIENYAIKNFRVFDENGVSFPLRPVSIITGCNSSGKSSIVKSVFLLKSFLEQVKNAYAENSTVSINKYKIDFTKYPNNLLGNFNKIIHNGSASKKITIAYTVYSRMLSKDAEVSLVFFSPENDELNNAYLESITISVDNEVFFFSSRNEESVCNLNLVKDCSSLELDELLKQDNFLTRTLQKLDSIGKPHTEMHLYDKIQKNADENVKLVSEKVIKNYLGSDHLLFSEYFKEIENLFFFNVMKKDSNPQPKHEIKLFPKKFPIFKTPTPIILSILSRYTDPKNALEGMKIIHTEQIELEQSIHNNIPFGILLWVFKQWDKILHTDIATFTSDITSTTPYDKFFNHIYSVIKDIICLDGINNMSYISSSRADVKRLYSLENQDDFSNLIKKYFEAKQYASYSSEDEYKPNSFINHWIQKFGIGDSISVKVNEDGLGVQLKIKKKEGSERLLADEGYGITQLVSVLLQIETSILSLKTRPYRGLYRVISIGDKYKSNKDYEPTTIAIEEPEIHLHPKYQSLLADMIVDAYKSYNIHFMIETHSEYLIRKLQLLVANKKIDSDEVSILYVNSAEDDPDGKVQVKSIQICKDGYLDDSFGPGFFDEATSLSRQLM